MANDHPSPSPMTAPAMGEELRRLRLHQRILRDFGQIARDELEIGLLLQRAVAQAARATGVGHTKVMRYRVEQGDLLIEAGVGWKPGVIGNVRFGTDADSPGGRALQTGEAVVIDDIRGHPEFRLHPVIAEHGIVSLLNVPVTFNSVAWGVLEADSERPSHFDEADVEFLETMAALLASALQHRAAVQAAEVNAAETAVRAERRAVLLRELQHRAKNNLALVAAMLAHTRRAATTEQNARAAEWTGQLMQQVTAIALAQDRLSVVERGGLGDGTATDLAGYLRALLGSLDLSLGSRVAVEAELDACTLPFDKAVAVGLVVNELITNAAKYAYPDGEEGGVVRVVLRCDATKAEASLTVSDEGRGMDPQRMEAAQRTGGGQGSSLLRHLARQLGGEVEQGTPERGTSISLRFPRIA
jgi:two-component sensor histidine kinase/putative methionine-R-sulfoxide reductase with GAF domain